MSCGPVDFRQTPRVLGDEEFLRASCYPRCPIERVRETDRPPSARTSKAPGGSSSFCGRLKNRTNRIISDLPQKAVNCKRMGGGSAA